MSSDPLQSLIDSRVAALGVGHDARGLYVITRVDDMAAVEDALPSGWTVGDNWWASDPSQEIRPGIWKLYLMRPKDVGGVKNAKLEEVPMPKIITLVDQIFEGLPPLEPVISLTIERDPGSFEANYPKIALPVSIGSIELERLVGPGSFIVRARGRSGTELGSMRVSFKAKAEALSAGDLVARAQKAEEELAAARAEIAALRAAKPRATMFVPGSEEHVAFWNAVEHYKDVTFLAAPSLREQRVAELETAAVALFKPSGADTGNPVQTIKGAYARLRKGEQIEESLRCLTNTIKQVIEDRDDARTAVMANQRRQASEIVVMIQEQAKRANARSLEHEKSDGALGLAAINHVMASSARNEASRLYTLAQAIGHKFTPGHNFAFEGRGSLLAGSNIGRMNDHDALDFALGVIARAEERIESLQWMLAERGVEVEQAALATANGINKRARAAQLTKLDSTAPFEHFDVLNEFDCEQEALAAVALSKKKW